MVKVYHLRGSKNITEIVIWVGVLIWTAFIPILSDGIAIKVVGVISIVMYYSVVLLKKEDLRIRFTRNGIAFYLSLSTLMILSSLFSKDILNSLAILMLFQLWFYSCWIAGISGIHQRMFKILTTYSLIGLLVITLIIVVNNVELSTKLGYIRSPNSLALILLSFLPGIVLLKKTWSLPLSFYLFTLLVLVGSRNGMLSFSIFFFVVLFIGGGKARLRSKFSIVFFCLIAIITYWEDIAFILQLNNSYRGLNSGFTGRSVAWLYSLQTILNNPMFGVGLGNAYLEFSNSNVTGTILDGGYAYMLTSTHNGYLALFLELGVISALLLLTKIISGMCKFIKIYSSGHGIIFVGFLASYLFFGVFEEVFINLGNPMSLIFMTFAIVGLSYERPISDGAK